jgi:DNA-binding winged helix-turn-helix (wHTH) protein
VTLRFDRLELDVEQRLALLEGEPVHLSPKAFQLLRILAEQAPRALSKGDLQELLWPSTFVSETSLAGLVSEVRSALKDGAHRSRYIRTVHGYGYAFAATPEQSADPRRRAASSRFRLILQGREIVLPAGDTLIGRQAADGILIDDASVSREHARISVSEDKATLTDSGSKNGTFVNGTRVTAPTPLRHGDVITFGGITVTFSETVTQQSTQTIHL